MLGLGLGGRPLNSQPNKHSLNTAVVLAGEWAGGLIHNTTSACSAIQRAAKGGWCGGAGRPPLIGCKPKVGPHLRLSGDLDSRASLGEIKINVIAPPLVRKLNHETLNTHHKLLNCLI